MGVRPQRQQQRFRPIYLVLHKLFPSTALWPRLIALGYMRQMQAHPPGPERRREADLALAWLSRTERLAAAKRERPLPELWRVQGLSSFARAAVEAGRLDLAEQCATLLLDLPGLLKDEDVPPHVSQGEDGLHDAHIVLGKVALARGHVEEAERNLFVSVQLPPRSGAFTTFGPDMELAQALLASGRRETVLSYLRACRRFWRMGVEQLDDWISEIDRRWNTQLQRPTVSVLPAPP